jgi:dephospho-CoA kinase
MRVAITGGIAEGKSTVLGYLREEGEAVASSDAYAREVFQEPDVQSALAHLLGQESPVEPAALRDALSSSATLRRDVNRLMHPKVIERILASRAKYIEVPLLIEGCLQSLFDQVWVVSCGPEEQRRRLVERVGEAAALELIATQLKTSVKTPFGDVVFRTNQPEETVKRYVKLAASAV